MVADVDDMSSWPDQRRLYPSQSVNEMGPREPTRKGLRWMESAQIVDWFLLPTALLTYTKLLASRGTMLNVEGKIIVPSSYGVLSESWEIRNKT